MEAAKIAQIIDEMGTLLELRGENPFRVRAYHTAAQALVELARRSARDDRGRALERGARHRRHDARQDRAARHDRPLAVVRRAAAEHAAGSGRALAHSRSRARRRSRRSTRRSRSRAWPTCEPPATRARSPSSRGLAPRRRPRSSRESRLSRKQASGSFKAMRCGWSPRSSRRCATIPR